MADGQWRASASRCMCATSASLALSSHSHGEAYTGFSYLGLVSEELKALQAALDWRAYFTLALSPANLNKPGQRQIASLAAAFADALATQCRFVEAGRVRLDYAQDVMGCVAELGRGTEWQEACRIVSRSLVCNMSSN